MSFVIEHFSKYFSLNETDIGLIGYPSYPLPLFTEQQLMQLCDLAKEVFQRQDTVGRISGNWIIVGDLHGSIHDLIRILNKNKPPPETNYLFLGDYVDRGNYSVEVIALLFALIIKFPFNIFMIRGNHEFRKVNRNYGFFQEINTRYSASLWEYFNNTFDYLPLACIVNNTYLCVHGGLGPQVKSVQLIDRIRRPVSEETPIISDLVWSDPTTAIYNYEKNPRGSGSWFGCLALRKFLLSQKLERLIRAHQLIAKGVSAFDEGKCVTVFSCSNYSGNRNYSGILHCQQDEELLGENYPPYNPIARDDCIFIKYEDTAPPEAPKKAQQILQKIKIRVRTSYLSETQTNNRLPLLSGRRHPSKLLDVETEI